MKNTLNNQNQHRKLDRVQHESLNHFYRKLWTLPKNKIFLSNRFEVREIRHWLDSGRQVALITTDPYMPL